MKLLTAISKHQYEINQKYPVFLLCLPSIEELHEAKEAIAGWPAV